MAQLTNNMVCMEQVC